MKISMICTDHLLHVPHQNSLSLKDLCFVSPNATNLIDRGYLIWKLNQDHYVLGFKALEVSNKLRSAPALCSNTLQNMFKEIFDSRLLKIGTIFLFCTNFKYQLNGYRKLTLKLHQIRILMTHFIQAPNNPNLYGVSIKTLY